MMRHRRVRAFTLMQIVYLLPIIAAGIAVTYEATTRAVRMERRMMEGVAGDARRADLVRRLGDDAGRARTAALERSDGTTLLVFQGCSPPSKEPNEESHTAADTSTVSYRVAAGEVTRTEQSSSESSGAFNWSLQPGDMDLAIENINDEPRLVWISFTKHQQRQEGPELTQKLTTAIRIGGSR